MASSNVSREFEYAEEPKQSSGWQLARDIGETIVLTLLMFLVIRLAVQDFQVDGFSMVPTLQDRQFVLVDKLTYFFSAPQRGDVIVFEFPRDHTQNYIKRIIGLPGDHVYVDGKTGQVSVNGIAINEPYVNNLGNPYGEVTLVLGANQYFVLGDNRAYSSDSRDWGPVKRSEIIGKASLVYWPLNVLHFLPNEHTIFAHVAQNGAGNTPDGKAVSTDSDPLSSWAFVILMPFALTTVEARKLLRRR